MTTQEARDKRARIVTIPNALTALRLVALPFFVIASIRGQFMIAFILFVAAGITDAVDGFIARRFDQRSRLGAILDPAADKTLMFSGYVIFTFGALVHNPLPVWLTMTIFARDVLIVLFAYLMFTRIRVRRFPPSVAGKVATLSQIVALSAAIAVNTSLERFIMPIAGPLFKLALIATLYSGFDYLRRGDRLLLKGEG